MNEELTREQRAEALASMLVSAGWQKVLKPAIQAELAVTIDEWSSGQRTKADEGVTDEGLKQRARALKWFLGWEDQYKRLAQTISEEKRLAEATEPAIEGGSPYVE